jgi:hypothetical protein
MITIHIFIRLRSVTPSIVTDDLLTEYQKRIEISNRRNLPLAFGTSKPPQHKKLPSNSKTIQSSLSETTTAATHSREDFEPISPYSRNLSTSYENLSEFREQIIAMKKNSSTVRQPISIHKGKRTSSSSENIILSN